MMKSVVLFLLNWFIDDFISVTQKLLLEQYYYYYLFQNRISYLLLLMFFYRKLYCSDHFSFPRYLYYYCVYEMTTKLDSNITDMKILLNFSYSDIHCSSKKIKSTILKTNKNKFLYCSDLLGCCLCSPNDRELYFI